VITFLPRLVARVVDVRYRPGVGTVYATVDRAGRRVVTIHLVDADRPDERLPVPGPLVRGLDGCWSPAEVRALLAGA
jgi:hypothetical protein